MASAIKIRSYRPTDAEAFHAAALESVAEVNPWLAWCHPDYSLAEAKAWTESRASLLTQGTEYEFAIVDASDRILGGCGLNQLNPTHRLANIGYWVRTSATGRGVATRAVRLVTDFAFAKTTLERLEILCAVGNRASQRVAERAGAEREGTLRARLSIHERQHDAVVYAIVRSQWRSE